MEMCREEPMETMSGRQPINILLVMDVPIFGLHFHTDLYPRQIIKENKLA